MTPEHLVNPETSHYLLREHRILVIATLLMLRSDDENPSDATARARRVVDLASIHANGDTP